MLQLLIASARESLAVAKGEIGEILARSTFASKVLEELGQGFDVQLTHAAKAWLYQLFRVLKAKPDIVAIRDGIVRALAEVKAVGLDEFKKNLDNYIEQLEKYANRFQQATFKAFYTRAENIEWLRMAEEGAFGPRLQQKVAEFTARLRAAGYGDALAIEGYDGALGLLRPPGLEA